MTESNFNLETNKYLSDCNSTDVIAFGSRGLFYIDKLCELVLASFDYNVNNKIVHSINSKFASQSQAKLWFEEGEECQIIKADSLGWQKGKIKLKVNVTLEFVPDEPEIETSPLDDLRQNKINNIK